MLLGWNPFVYEKPRHCYVYRHIRTDKNEVFYIGIGSTDKNGYPNRAHNSSSAKRTKYWHNISSKGYIVEIILSGLTWDEAAKKEIEFISLYGRADLGKGTLCNLTDGGQGRLNIKPSPETCKKISQSKLGKKLSAFHIKRMSESRKGKKITEKMIEGRKKSPKGKGVLHYNYGKKLSDETKRKIGAIHKGRKLSPEMLAKMVKKGADNHGSRLVLNTETGVFYDTLKDAAFYHNLHRNYILRRVNNMNKKSKNKSTRFIYC